MTRYRLFLPLLLLLLGPVSLAAERAGTLRVAINTDIRSTNPGVNRDANTDMVIHHLVESLVGYGADLSIQPVLAESIRQSEDGLSYVFRLKPGVRFHNGELLTSAEVVWNWRRYLDPATQWQCRRWFSGDNDTPGSSDIKTVHAPDPATVVFELAAPSPLFLDQLANVQCPSAIVHPSSLDAEGNWLQPVGTGPFELTEWRRGDFIDLTAFPGYHSPAGETNGFAGAKPVHVERLRFQVSPDHAATKAALQSGGIDIYPGVPMNSLAELSQDEDIELAETALLGWTVLLTQTRDPLLSDVAMRRAIAHAIDREQIVGFNTYGHASPNASAVPVADPRHTEVHDRWYAPGRDKAAEWLEAAGYDGEIVEIQTNRRYSNMYDNAVVIQAMLQSAGINARLSVLDWASQLANYYSGDFQLSAFSFSALAHPISRYLKLIGDKDARATYQWDSAEARGLLAGLLDARTELERQRYYDALHRLMVEEVPIIGLYNAHAVTAHRQGLSGVEPWPLGIPLFWGVRPEAPGARR